MPIYLFFRGIGYFSVRVWIKGLFFFPVDNSLMGVQVSLGHIFPQFVLLCLLRMTPVNPGCSQNNCKKMVQSMYNPSLLQENDHKQLHGIDAASHPDECKINSSQTKAEEPGTRSVYTPSYTSKICNTIVQLATNTWLNKQTKRIHVTFCYGSLGWLINGQCDPKQNKCKNATKETFPVWFQSEKASCVWSHHGKTSNITIRLKQS